MRRLIIWDFNGTIINDVDLCLNILAGIKGGLYYLDVVTTKYRIYQGNTIGLGHEKKLKERTALVQRNLEEKYQEWSILKKCNADEYSIGYIQKVIAVFNYRVDYLLTGNICSFVDSLIKSLQIIHQQPFPNRSHFNTNAFTVKNGLFTIGNQNTFRVRYEII